MDFSPVRQTPPQTALAPGRPIGCLVVAAIVLAPYLLNGVTTLGTSLVNQLKWHTHGSSSYTASVSLIALSPLAGQNVITVRRGQVVAGQHAGRELGADPAIFNEITIEHMFLDAYDCTVYYPLLVCSFEYDPYYGYPRRVSVDCPLPSACLRHLTTRDVQVSGP